MTIKTIRVKNPEGPGWITVNFQGVAKITIRDISEIGAVIQIEGHMPQAIGSDLIHPEDYKLLIEHFGEDKD